MLKQKYFLTDFFILSAEKQPIKLSWRNIEWLQKYPSCKVDAYVVFYSVGFTCLDTWCLAIPEKQTKFSPRFLFVYTTATWTAKKVSNRKTNLNDYSFI